MQKRRLLPVLLGVIAIAVGGFERSARADLLINGAGATFPYPIYSKWFDVYAKENPGIKFNYQSIGSGGGIRMLSNRTVDVGATDAPLTDAQLAAAPANILHFPSVMGADVIAYNLPDFSGTMRLTGPVIADIFMGKITKWDDDKIKALNPGASIPSTDVVVCHRSDGSGTSYIFTDYLSKVSPGWSSDVGKGTSVKWPAGLGGKGNEGVTALVQQTPGAIGYVELIYALNNKIPFAEIQNKAGNWVQASLEGVTAAAASGSGNMPADFRVSITEAPGADAYPISSFTWLLVYQKQTKKDVGEQIKKFLQWALHDGQKYAPELKYAPLPAAVVQKEEAQLQTIQVP
ncbi:MAG: phosphate ABC transporter substrate-binding protein PstS [Candidatus Binatus sp.]|uniref:phosphate ABC transporter substrate-binding protein PstS n=1 Tax=Candidatus Binatus sp. TaxID=2811406 RepID=UPI002719AB7C|nr:phosphate ABC transporter substrate-binding protein PstS [Candidatus Binatus sp.]MDO8431959.1 phosphate ABC transporter substrate-binding protein PstS [Candidatus Binatus sp.]